MERKKRSLVEIREHVHKRLVKLALENERSVTEQVNILLIAALRRSK